MSPILRRARAGLIAIGAAMSLASSAQAADPVPTRTVTHRDLNLATDAGARELLKRIERASAAICDVERRGSQGLEVALRYEACTDATVEAAVRAVGLERLTVLRTEKTARSPVAATLAAQR